MEKGLEFENRITNYFANGLRLMPKTLYDDILSDMISDEIIALFYRAESYNTLYSDIKEIGANKLLHGMTKIDEEIIIKKSLETKDIKFINALLLWAPQYQSKAFEFLKNCNDDRFTYDFIYGVRFDWNPYFEFLKNFKHLDARILWNNVVKENELDAKNMLTLLDGEKWHVLKIMYFMNNIEKIKNLPRNIVSYYFMLNSEKIKEIDLDFYNKIVEYWITNYEYLINNVIKLYRNSIKGDDIQLSFYNLNIDDLAVDSTIRNQVSLVENQRYQISSILSLINSKKGLSNFLKPLVNTYLLIKKEEIKKIDIGFYETRIKPLITINTAKLIDIIAKDYIDLTLNDGILDETVQISFVDYLNDKETSVFCKK